MPQILLCSPDCTLCPPGSSGKALGSSWGWMICGQWGSRTPLKKLLPGQKESGRSVRAEPSSEYLIWRADHGLSWAVLDDLFHSWKHRTNFLWERSVFDELLYYWTWDKTQCEITLWFFWKYKIPKISPVVGDFLIVSSFRKMESATFKKGQKTESGTAEAEETEALLQSKHSQSGPLLRVFWSMFGTYFLLSTVCLVICDVFLFSTPKVLRYVHIYDVFLSHVQDCYVHELTDLSGSTHRHTMTFWNLLLLMEGAHWY